MYNMVANFYPAQEPKSGYIGKANLTIANAFRISDISVFEKDGKLNLGLPGYEGKDGVEHSYLQPLNKEAFADMCKVMEMAVQDQERHFGHVAGKMNIDMSVTGALVDEPYADGRFSVRLGDFCELRGISTREMSLKNKEGSFVAVDMPRGESYVKDGEKVYPNVIQPLKRAYQKDGETITTDFGQIVSKMIRNARKDLMERKPSLDEQVQDAKEQGETVKEAPVKDAQVKESPVKKSAAKAKNKKAEPEK